MPILDIADFDGYLHGHDTIDQKVHALKIAAAEGDPIAPVLISHLGGFSKFDATTLQAFLAPGKGHLEKTLQNDIVVYTCIQQGFIPCITDVAKQIDPLKTLLGTKDSPASTAPGADPLAVADFAPIVSVLEYNPGNLSTLKTAAKTVTDGAQQKVYGQVTDAFEVTSCVLESQKFASDYYSREHQKHAAEAQKHQAGHQAPDDDEKESFYDITDLGNTKNQVIIDLAYKRGLTQDDFDLHHDYAEMSKITVLINRATAKQKKLAAEADPTKKAALQKEYDDLLDQLRDEIPNQNLYDRSNDEDNRCQALFKMHYQEAQKFAAKTQEWKDLAELFKPAAATEDSVLDTFYAIKYLMANGEVADLSQYMTLTKVKKFTASHLGQIEPHLDTIEAGLKVPGAAVHLATKINQKAATDKVTDKSGAVEDYTFQHVMHQMADFKDGKTATPRTKDKFSAGEIDKVFSDAAQTDVADALLQTLAKTTSQQATQKVDAGLTVKESFQKFDSISLHSAGERSIPTEGVMVKLLKIHNGLTTDSAAKVKGMALTHKGVTAGIETTDDIGTTAESLILLLDPNLPHLDLSAMPLITTAAENANVPITVVASKGHTHITADPKHPTNEIVLEPTPSLASGKVIQFINNVYDGQGGFLKMAYIPSADGKACDFSMTAAHTVNFSVANEFLAFGSA